MPLLAQVCRVGKLVHRQLTSDFFLIDWEKVDHVLDKLQYLWYCFGTHVLACHGSHPVANLQAARQSTDAWFLVDDPVSCGTTENDLTTSVGMKAIVGVITRSLA